MQILTLTTDMGERDHYVASLKGTILRSCPDIHIVDISHNVHPFDVAEAAFYLRSCIHDFPKGTVHVIGVDSEPILHFSEKDDSLPCLMNYRGQFIVSNDNGFFGSFLNEETHDGFFRLDNVLSNSKSIKFPTKNILLPAACHILKGEKIEDFCTPYHSFKKAFAYTAVLEPNVIKGNVIHIDNYGNLISNIHRSLFDRYEKDTPFTIYYRNKDYFIDVISETYNAVPHGEKVALFNQNDFLEIAINRGANRSNGGAERLFGVRIGDIIRVEFTPLGSHTTFDSLF